LAQNDIVVCQVLCHHQLMILEQRLLSSVGLSVLEQLSYSDRRATNELSLLESGVPDEVCGVFVFAVADD
jgi:hypothetical protein